MFRRTVALAALGFAVLTASSADAQFKGGPKGGEAKSGWLGSLAEGKSQADKTGKPMMIVIRCVP